MLPIGNTWLYICCDLVVICVAMQHARCISNGKETRASIYAHIPTHLRTHTRPANRNDFTQNMQLTTHLRKSFVKQHSLKIRWWILSPVACICIRMYIYCNMYVCICVRLRALLLPTKQLTNNDAATFACSTL